MNDSRDVKRVLRALDRHGLMLKVDARLPSVTSLVAGEAVRGSWWAHPRGHVIFRVLCQLAEHPDVLFLKLEWRLLIVGHDVHTESGRHAKCLETWDHWVRRVQCDRSAMSASGAKQQLAVMMESLNAEFNGKGRLPWTRS